MSALGFDARTGEPVAAIVAGQFVRYTALGDESVRGDGSRIWEVVRVWNTNTEGWRANLKRVTDDGTPVHCIAAAGDCQRID